MGKIFYLMGKSSSGKDTIYKQLQKRCPELSTITLYTTRPVRENEVDGREYHFVDEDQLQSLEENGKVIELRSYDTVHGIWKYFTVDDGQIDLKNKSYLVIGTLESYEQMCQYFGEHVVIPIYLEVEDGERLQRALLREQAQSMPKYAEMCRRFLADSKDFSEDNLLKAGIQKRFQNLDSKRCTEEIVLYIQESLCYN